MFNIGNLMDTVTLLPDWFVAILPIYRNVTLILIALCAVVLIVVVLMQTSAQNSGASALTGITESYYAQNKSNTKEGRLKRITSICAITILVLIVVYFVPSLFTTM